MLHLKTNILAIFKANTHISKLLTNIENIFKKINVFVYILTNENHYKDFLNNGLFYKILSKTTQSIISNNFKSKASDLQPGHVFVGPGKDLHIIM